MRHPGHFRASPAAPVARAPRPKQPSSPSTDQPPAQPAPVIKTAALEASELNGTYTGIWQSRVFAASGAAIVTVSTEGNRVHAEIALTGGTGTRDTLTGEVTEVGGGWSVTLKNASGDLYATGI